MPINQTHPLHIFHTTGNSAFIENIGWMQSSMKSTEDSMNESELKADWHVCRTSLWMILLIKKKNSTQCKAMKNIEQGRE